MKRTIILPLYHFARRIGEWARLFFKRRALRGRQEMFFLGKRLAGQGFMIANYAAQDHEKFVRSFEPLFAYMRRDQPTKHLTVLDIGANLGFYAFAFSTYKPVTVLAYEPSRESFAYLRENLERNQEQDIQAFPIALHSKTGMQKIGSPLSLRRYSSMMRWLKSFDREESGCRSLLYDEESETETVECYRGDERPELLGCASIDLIKIDVEGAEFDVLRGLEELLRKHVPVLQLECSADVLTFAHVDHTIFIRFLTSCGYTHVISRAVHDDWWKGGERLEGYRFSNEKHDLVFYSLT